MGRRIYIEGGLLITTPLFASARIVAGCGSQPDGTEVVKPSTIVEGFPCLVVDDNHPLSFFDEFYVRDFVSSGTIGTPYFTETYENCFKRFNKQISEVQLMVNDKSGLLEARRPLLNKLLYSYSLTILDAYICSCVITAVTHDESTFLNYYRKMVDTNRKAKLSDYLIRNDRGRWEQYIIKEDILKKSFLNGTRIKDSFSVIGWGNIPLGQIITQAVENRHILVHRNGRRLDGSVITIDDDQVRELIRAVQEYIDKVKAVIDTLRG